jgi:uncharacterized protein YjbI with pentapeptide repeats
LIGVNLKELAVPPEALRGCVVDVTTGAIARTGELRARLEAHQQWVASGGTEGSPAVLDGEDLRPLQQMFVGRQLTGLSARDAVAIGVDFRECQLQGARFEGADLRDADFTSADLRGVSFKAAKLNHARFERADLRSFRLLNGAMRVTDLSDAQKTEHQFDGALLEGAAETAPRQDSAVG